MINVGEIVSDPDFAQAFTIARSSGGYFDPTGTWQETDGNIDMWGIIQPATAKELLQVPEGDRVKEVKSFHSQQGMFVTHTDGLTDANAATSDIVTWLTTGEQYRLVKLYQWIDFGYYKALGVRIAGE